MDEPWVEFFEVSDLRGRGRRIYGPISLAPIPKVPWAGAIESVASGRNSYVRLYDSRQPTETIAWLRPNAIIASLSKLNDGKRIDSVDLLSVPPVPGQAGYELYLAHYASSGEAH